MEVPGAPMQPPPLRPLLGAPLAFEQLVNYGYRASWKVTAPRGVFVVKADHRPSWQLREAAAQNNAHAGGVPVPGFVAFREEPLPYLVMHWVDGVPLHGRRSRAAWQDAGRVLRMAHRIAPLARRRQAWADWVSEGFKTGLPGMVESGAITAEAAAAALDRVAALGPLLEVAPLVALHGDCQAEHILVDAASDTVTAVIDWADAQQGDPLFDFAVLTLFDREMVEAVLTGYGASPQLRSRAVHLLPLYRALRAIREAPWLRDHGFDGETWPAEELRAFCHPALSAPAARRRPPSRGRRKTGP